MLVGVYKVLVDKEGTWDGGGIQSAGVRGSSLKGTCHGG